MWCRNRNPSLGQLVVVDDNDDGDLYSAPFTFAVDKTVS